MTQSDQAELSSPPSTQLSPVSEHVPVSSVPNGNPHSHNAIPHKDSPIVPAPQTLGHGGRNRSSSSPLRGSDLTEPARAVRNSASRRKSTIAPLDTRRASRPDIAKLSPAQIYDLTTAPDSLPIRTAPAIPNDIEPLCGPRRDATLSDGRSSLARPNGKVASEDRAYLSPEESAIESSHEGFESIEVARRRAKASNVKSAPARPGEMHRSYSIPIQSKREGRPSESLRTPSPAVGAAIRQRLTSRKHRDLDSASRQQDPRLEPPPSPVLPKLPVPPNSLPTYLQLELSSDRPSPLYIHRPASSDVYYESSKVKFERLVNFFQVPVFLEQLLLFGALACLDSWLYTFTVLPLRFGKSLWLLVLWVWENISKELRDLARIVWAGLGRLWRRTRQQDVEPAAASEEPQTNAPTDEPLYHRRSKLRRHRRTKSVASSLQQNHKADLLQGLLIVTSCIILMRFDASRMYHSIRGQAAIKLYVIYNVLEVFDRLLSAVGQDILECLFSKETLERKADGRSKVLRPLWMFFLALVYTIVHATGLFYQVITLNVAVNSYSNALLTLLMSNQFVEIKGSVFKKFEKENLFQLTCADVVERFQLWLMLLVIALRNIVEVGGLSINTRDSTFSGPSSTGGTSTSPPMSNTTNPVSSYFSILPDAFELLPSVNSFQVLSPFLLVLGSEMLVDWLKHAYITKFNATSPRIYARFFDILAKDYYAHAFVDQNLTRRLGLPVIPLACLFIRAALQTYHMFLATNLTAPTLSAATSLVLESEAPTSSPVLAQIDAVLRRALGQSSFGGGTNPEAQSTWLTWTADDVIALTTMLLFFLALYLLLLALKLALGMLLLGIARKRYEGMKARETELFSETSATRVGGWGAVEVGEERRRVIYDEAPEELRGLREKERGRRGREDKDSKGLEGVDRYSMVAKRIW